MEFENYIVGEVVLPINHTLSGLKGTTLDQIERVYSHPQALMQSAKFLDAHRDWQQISVANTAVAAKKVLEDQDQRKAAICSEYAQRACMDWKFWRRRLIIMIIIPRVLLS